MKRKILIADSDEVSLFFYGIILRNYDLTMVQDGERALEKFIEEEPHLVIVNHSISTQNGFELTKNIKNLNQTIPVVMVSSSITTEKKAISAGCDGFYTKPIRAEKIIEIVKNTFAKN